MPEGQRTPVLDIIILTNSSTRAGELLDHLTRRVRPARARWRRPRSAVLKRGLASIYRIDGAPEFGPDASTSSDMGDVHETMLTPRAWTRYPNIRLIFLTADRGAQLTDGVLTPEVRVDDAVGILAFDDLAQTPRCNDVLRSWMPWLKERKSDAHRGRLGIAVSVVLIAGGNQTTAAANRRLEIKRFLEAHFTVPRVHEPVDEHGFRSTVLGRGSTTLEKQIRWALQSANPMIFSPGIGGILARTSAPTLWTYTVILWIGFVVAPTLPQKGLGAVCGVVSLLECASLASVAAAELRDLDVVTIGVALLATILLYVGMRVLLPSSRQKGMARMPTARIWRTASLAAAWTIVLFPRAVLAIGAHAVIAAQNVGQWDRVGLDKLIEAALFAQDLRPTSIASASAVSMVVFLVAWRLRAWNVNRHRVLSS